MTRHIMPVGTTEGQVFRLKSDAQPNGIDLSGGATVAIVVHDNNGSLVTSPGTVSIVTPSTGVVKLVPDPAKWTVRRGPYAVRWQVTSGVDIYFVPNTEDPDEWVVTV